MKEPTLEMHYDPEPDDIQAKAIFKDPNKEPEYVTLVRDDGFSDIQYFHFYYKGIRIDNYEQAGEHGIMGIILMQTIKIDL